MDDMKMRINKGGHRKVWRGTLFIRLQTLVVYLFAVLSKPAVAQVALPDLSGSNKYCDGLAAMFGDNKIFRDNCLDMEKTSKAKAERLWPVTPASLQSSCLTMLKAGNTYTYQALLGCMSLGIANMWTEGKVQLTERVDGK